MSDTPISDAAFINNFVPYSVAWTLETRLAAVTAERDALHTAIVHAVALLNRSPSVAECEQGRTAHDILRHALIGYADRYDI